jgi:hypothetical protein
LDEPLSNIPGFTKNDREYLNYIYSKNDPRSYEIVAQWKNLIDAWTNNHNQEEKVHSYYKYDFLQ